MKDSKPRGRPSGEKSRHVVEALLRAAEECVKDKQFKDITVREIAALADVNPAMINYYFNNKEGLFVALIEFLFVEWEEKVAALVSDMKAGGESPTARFVALVDECYYQHAPIIRLLHQELTEEDSGIQAAYRQRLASRTTKAMGRFIERAAELGHYRQNLDVRFASLTLACVAIHPISLESSAMEAAYDIRLDELRSPEWLSSLNDNIERLFAS